MAPSDTDIVPRIDIINWYNLLSSCLPKSQSWFCRSRYDDIHDAFKQVAGARYESPFCCGTLTNGDNRPCFLSIVHRMRSVFAAKWEYWGESRIRDTTYYPFFEAAIKAFEQPEDTQIDALRAWGRCPSLVAPQVKTNMVPQATNIDAISPASPALIANTNVVPQTSNIEAATPDSPAPKNVVA